jgi:hypothetical protein
LEHYEYDAWQISQITWEYAWSHTAMVKKTIYITRFAIF